MDMGTLSKLWGEFHARFGFAIKIAFLLTLVALLLIPLDLIQGLIGERKVRRDTVVTELTGIWGRPQSITGPVLVIPYRYTIPDTTEGRTVMSQPVRLIGRIYVLPESLAVTGALEPTVRYRGIFEAVLYKTALKLTGSFRLPDLKALAIPPGDVLWDQAILAVGVSDLRGASGQTRLDWAGSNSDFKPRTLTPILGAGMHAPLALTAPDPNATAQPIPFSFDINFTGSRRITFAPVGKTSTISMVSTWRHPSFDGAYLPSEREIAAEGFRAKWVISYLGRDYPQLWKSHGPKGEPLLVHDIGRQMANSQFGVSLVTPVDFYLKAERSVKYGILFVLLVLAAIFAFDVAGGLNLHVFQYALVGAALCVFYLLLLSLAEFAGFLAAYLIAAVMATAMIGVYAAKVMGGWGRAGVIAGLLATVYAFLYVVLQLEDYALLVGSLGVFAALAAVMYGTRNVDWHALRGGPAPKQAKQA